MKRSDLCSIFDVRSVIVSQQIIGSEVQLTKTSALGVTILGIHLF